MKEHQDACEKGLIERSTIAEHAWTQHHSIAWEETAIVDQARRRKELMLKEALHIQTTSEEQRFYRDVGLELPGCWVATIQALTRRSRKSSTPNTEEWNPPMGATIYRSCDHY